MIGSVATIALAILALVSVLGGPGALIVALIVASPLALLVIRRDSRRHKFIVEGRERRRLAGLEQPALLEAAEDGDE